MRDENAILPFSLVTAFILFVITLMICTGCGNVTYNAATHELHTFTLFKDISAKVVLPDGTAVELTSNTNEAAINAAASGAAAGAVKGLRP